jgi:hypothetical protein
MSSLRKQPISPPVTDEAIMSAMRARVYLEASQVRQASQWLYDRHKFRNEAVAFLQNRRRARGACMVQWGITVERSALEKSLAGCHKPSPPTPRSRL